MLQRRNLLMVATALALAAFARLARADGAWLAPVNLSQSGSAAQPALAVTTDGTMHVVWWDSFDGAMYAQVVVRAGSISTKTVVSQIQGPRNLSLWPGVQGRIHALWSVSDGSLLTASMSDAAWGQAITLTNSAAAFDVSADMNGVVRLAYVRTAATPDRPAGVYVRSNAAITWTEPVLVYASPYVRTAKTESLHVSAAGVKSGQVVVVWDDPLLEQSVLSRSSDGGVTWSAPQRIVDRQWGSVQKARVAATASGEFLLIWQDVASGACGLTQARSGDGGKTWTAPERIMPTITHCPERWRFAVMGDGRLWLVALPAASAGSPVQTGTLAAWDGQSWATPVDVGLSFVNPATAKSVTLSSLALAMGGQTIGVAGCDDKGDVWASANAVSLDQLAPALHPLWGPVRALSDGKGAVDLPAVASDTQGRVYVMWRQAAAGDNDSAALYLALWDGRRWTDPIRLFETETNPAVVAADTQLKAEQPALSVDGKGRLHAVWSGGVSGQIMYSWAFGPEAMSQTWADPVDIPSPTGVGSWPDIVADPRSDVLHLIYAIPYNEKRGVYYNRSQARGTQGIASWLTPTVVFDAVSAGWDSVSKPRLALDAPSNTLHAVWLRSALPGSGLFQSLYYARSTDGGQSWSVAQKVTEGAIDWPRIAAAGNQVHILWNRLRPDGSADLWSQYSTNRGEQWSQPAAVRGFARLSGPAGLAADGAGTLYLAAVGEGAQGESVLLSSRWDGAAWGRNESASLGQNAALGQGATLVVSAAAGRLTVVLQQSVLSTNGLAQLRVTTVGRDVAAAEVKLAPTFTPLATRTPTRTRTPQATATPVTQFPMPDSATTPPSDLLSRQLPLLAGGSLSILVVLGVVVARVLAASRRQ